MSNNLPNVAVMRKLNRDRVLAFEEEIKEKLHVLEMIEKQIQDTGVRRKEWLSNIANTYQTESEVHNKMIEVIKAESDLASLHLKLDLLRLDEQYESQKLSLLIEATRPLEEDESPEERELLLKMKSRGNSDILCSALQHSLDYRLQLMDHIHELNITLVKVKSQAKAELQSQVDDVRMKLEGYKMKMQVSAQKSQKVYNRVLREYLILRHNALVAEQILQRSQSDATAARSELQKCLEKLLAEADRQKEKASLAAEKELAVQTADMRADVMRKEHELEELISRVTKLQHQRQHDIRDLHEEIERYDRKYRALQNKRKEDLVSINAELQMLQEIITEKQRTYQNSIVSAAKVDEASEALAKLRQLFDGIQLSNKTRPCRPRSG